MTDVGWGLLLALRESGIPAAVLDAEESAVRILCDQAFREPLRRLLKRQGWRRVRGGRETYLYGMEPFLQYVSRGASLTVCFRLACRSTLDGAWVPLDRRINEGALARAAWEGEALRLCPEDELCYRLAKCVYTERAFSETDVCRIKACLRRVDRKELEPKLEGVFFRFSEPMLRMIAAGDYSHVIRALWQFAGY